MKWLRGSWQRDEGRVSLLVAVVVPALLFLIAAVVDAGGQVRAMQRADNIAAQAARTAGQQIDYPQAISGGIKVIDPQRAVAAAQEYLREAGATGTVTVSPNRQQITVSAAITYQPLMLGVFGRGSVSITGQSSAQLVTGP
ncbi:MAG: pilus assembly protein [Kribbellaceae bacterium]|nr:pilus assembly protein [Kribbellaceae bacterium]